MTRTSSGTCVAYSGVHQREQRPARDQRDDHAADPEHHAQQRELAQASAQVGRVARRDVAAQPGQDDCARA
ncbi:MAG: hypothetical protein IPJ24_04785 [bacterium]|nr:hypothetical protein [bacterium]